MGIIKIFPKGRDVWLVGWLVIWLVGWLKSFYVRDFTKEFLTTFVYDHLWLSEEARRHLPEVNLL